MKKPTTAKWDQVVIGLEVSLILNHRPGLLDRGLILGFDHDAVYETLIRMADCLTAYYTLGHDYYKVEDDLNDVLDFLEGEVYPDEERTHATEHQLSDYRDELINAALDLRTLLPLNATNLFLLNRIIPKTMIHIGALLHHQQVPEDYWKHAEYYRS